MSIKDWPASERPREKLLARGAEILSDAELLAIFLRTGTRGQSAVDLARKLLLKFGGIRQLLMSDKDVFCNTPGLGQARFALLQATLEMSRRHQWETLKKGTALTDPHAVTRYLESRLRDYPHEIFACLFLDTRHRVIHFEEIFRGTIDSASVYPREILSLALKHHAAAVILTHNHPSGHAEPSVADRQITKRLSDALALVDIRVLDHIIIGDGETCSFAKRGMI